jgi:hypothetical protein
VDESGAALWDVTLAIRDRVTDATEQSSGVPLRRRLRDAADLITYGEPVVALEMLCERLFEFDVPLRASDYEQIGAAGRALELPMATWTVLENQVSSDPE